MWRQRTASSCEDYWEFDQEHAGAIGEAKQQVGSGASYDAQATRAMIDDATKTLPMFEIVNTLEDPDVSVDEKAELMGSSDLNEIMEAERNLIEICEAEIN